MSRQRQRHQNRQPTEESARLAISTFVGSAGEVDVQRMAYDWRADDLLVVIRLHQPVSGSTLTLFRRELARIMRTTIPAGDPLQDWLAIIEHEGQTVARVAHSDKQEDEVQE